MPRVLVTGSRTWTDREQIRRTLDAAVQVVGGTPTLLHGGCKMRPGIEPGARPLYTTDEPEGADAIADALWRSWGLPVEIRFADWNTHGRGAGHRRNAEMVATRPDLVCAFLLDGSPGTTGCIELAEREGLRIDVVERRTTKRGQQQRRHTYRPWSEKTA